jgi:hypothetical protein
MRCSWRLEEDAKQARTGMRDDDGEAAGDGERLAAVRTGIRDRNRRRGDSEPLGKPTLMERGGEWEVLERAISEPDSVIGR